MFEDRSAKGVAAFYIRGLIALVIGGIVWFAGEILLFDKDIGFVATTENVSNATQTHFPAIGGAIEWFWHVFPFVMMVGCFIWVVYGALKKEPYEV